MPDDHTKSVVSIATVQALAELVHDHALTGRPLIDYGRFHQGLGNPPAAGGTSICYRGEQIEHFESDFTVRAESGVTIGQLQKQLACVGQFISVDADEAMTLGECLAHNVYGPLRLSYGSLRDMTLGMAFLNAAGESILTGGRTVKNVAGYDVSRFMVGNLNELGLIYQATLRTYALPAHARLVTLHCENPVVVDQALTRWLLSDAKPTWLTLRNSERGWQLHVGYHGSWRLCQSHRQALNELLIHLPGVEFEREDASDFAGDARHRASLSRWRLDCPALVKLIVTPNQTGQWAKRILEQYPLLQIQTLPAHGCLWAGGNLEPDQVTHLDRMILDGIQGIPGYRVWHQRPSPNLETVAPFAPAQPEESMLHNLKNVLDPKRIFNPGRSINGSGCHMGKIR